MTVPVSFYANNRICLWQGDVLETLRQLPAESVHCCVTSPPYWGLRSYGTEAQVWGARNGCEHEWGTERYDHSQADTASGIEGSPRLGNQYIASRGQLCSLCGAWRGDLGLEPRRTCTSSTLSRCSETCGACCGPTAPVG